MAKQLKDKKLTGPARTAEKLRAEITTFRDRLPVIQVLCNKGMQGRHWGQISEVSGYAVTPDKTTTLEQLLALKLEKHMEQIEEIGVAASKEYSLEKALRAMKTEWGEMEFSFNPCKLCLVPHFRHLFEVFALWRSFTSSFCSNISLDFRHACRPRHGCLHPFWDRRGADATRRSHCQGPNDERVAIHWSFRG